MNAFCTRAALATGAAVFFLASAVARADAPIGEATSVAQKATAKGDAAPRNLDVGTKVVARDTIATDKIGKAAFRFLDDTRLSVGPNSSVTLADVVMSGPSGPKAFVLRASRGVFRFATGSGDHDAYRIQTPTATIGVRGTQFDVSLEGEQTRVSVLDGEVVLCPNRGRANFADCVEAVAGQSVLSGRIDSIPRATRLSQFRAATECPTPPFTPTEAQHMTQITRRAGIAGLFATLAAPALAQPWRPDRPIELVVGFAPGGGTDVVARLFARHLEGRLGQPITVVNRPGASSEVGMTHVARSRPDGHTLGLTNMPSFVTIPVERRAQYNLDSFAFIGNIMTDATGLIVKADSPITSVADLVARAKADPEAITISTSGIGTDDHLLLAMLSQQTGARFTIVHYTGAPPQRNALMGRQVHVNTVSVGEVMPQPDGVRFIGHAGREASRFAPGVPTMRSLGMDIEMYSERGLVLPRATPAAIVERMREAVAETAADPATRTTFEAQFIEPNYEAGPLWEARMRATQGQYAELWRRAPWINS